MTDKLVVAIDDEAFRGQDSTNYFWRGESPIIWKRENIEQDEPLVIYTDDRVWEGNKKGKIKVAWLFEGRSLKPVNYEYVETIGREAFDYIFTWDRQLLERFPDKAIFIPYGGSYIQENEMQIYEKVENLSIIASTKEKLPGHQLRQDVIAKYGEQMQGIFGRGRNYIDSVLTGYKDYRFTFVIENESRDYGFSEKLTTPMLCGTVPIYFGCPSIDKFFNKDGIIQFNSLEELDAIMPTLTETKYHEMMPAIQDNFDRARKLVLMEDTVIDVIKRLLPR